MAYNYKKTKPLYRWNYVVVYKTMEPETSYPFHVEKVCTTKE